MKILAIKPLHAWTCRGNTYVYAPYSTIVHGDKAYDLVPLLENGDEEHTDTVVIEGVGHSLFLLLLPTLGIASIAHDVDPNMSSISTGFENTYLDEEVPCTLVPITVGE